MLTNTFCHLPGVGEKTERSVWAAGVNCWEAALSKMTEPTRPLKAAWSTHLQESVQHHQCRDLGYFTSKLRLNQHWRIYQEFQEFCVFLDIETTGLYYGAEITTAVLYDGRTIRTYINGENLAELPNDLADYAVLITYNGRSFDIPFIERYFQIRLPQAQIDLRYILRQLGLKGGLKGCERMLGIQRPGMEEVDGYVAVLLWNEFQRRQDPKALETLLAYNIQDTLSLHTLMVHAHNSHVTATPFSASHCLPAPSLPDSPYQADHDALDRVCFRAGFSSNVSRSWATSY